MCVSVLASLVLLLSFQGGALGADSPAAPAPEALTPAEALDRLFTSESIQAEWFVPAFLAQVSVAQVEQIIAQLSAGLGEYQGVQAEGSQYLVNFTGGVIPTQIALNAGGQITTLFFLPPRPRVSSLDEAVAPFEELPGRVGLLVLRENTPLAALEAEAPFAVASAFKLAVLAALKTEIDAGARSWSEVVTLPAEAISLPSGLLHDWPAGSPLTLHTLAALMISISDNTATDALIRIIGREKIEPYAPRNLPLLTTREVFILKNPEHAPVLERYRAAPVDGRRAMLDELIALPLPDVTRLASDPFAPDIEWFFSPWELCGLMRYVEELPLMSINPGIARPEEWARVSYKGGSEPGVLSLVTGLEDENGVRTCVAAVWNHDTPLDETRFFGLYSGLLDALAKME